MAGSALSLLFQLFLRWASVYSVMLVIQGIDNLDRLSRDCLVYAARKLKGHPLFFLGFATAHHVNVPVEEQMRLRPLDLAGVRSLLQLLFKGPVDMAVLDLVFRKAGGNPFHILECARLLETEGWVDWRGTQYCLVGGNEAPARLERLRMEDVLLYSIRDLSDAAFDALRPWLALYIGGMGAKNKNFYHEYATRLGYGDAADQIQDLYLSGKKSEAEALVPNELLDEVSLVGPRERIIERLGPWKEAGKRGEVGSMLLGVQDPVVLELLANEML